MRIATTLAILTAFLLVGCGEQSSTVRTATPVAPSDVAGQVVQAALNSQDLELGCASCIYKMAGVEGCVTAVKVGGKPMLLAGKMIDAHELGLCSAAKQASVNGKVEDGKFVATEVELN